MAVAVRTRRLPGIAFEAEPPPPPRILPRMDITGFVGFAAAGPISVPVVVEDPAELEDVFGADAPLAWDGERGERVLAQLAPAVRAFFRNGGRRAWVVRVAAPSAVRSLLPVPGLVARPPGGAIGAASLPARACGSWADDLRVGAALTSTPSVLLSVEPDTFAFSVDAGAAKIVPGDLLRVGAGDFELLVAVQSVEAATVVPQTSPPASRAPGRRVLTVTGDPDTAVWLERIEAPYGATGTAEYVDSAGNAQSAAVQVVAPGSPPGSPPSPPSPPEPAETLVLELDLPAAQAPQPGTLVSVEGLSPSPSRVLWLAVETVGEAREPGETKSRVHVSGRPTWVRATPPVSWPDFRAGIAVETLTFELWARRSDTDRLVLGDLGFVPGHPRYVGDLPVDEELYTGRSPVDGPAPELWSAAAHPRFPLAGGPAGTVYYPLGIDVIPRTFLGPLDAPGEPLERDGLDRFDDALFLDPELRSAGLDALAAEAEYIRWQSPQPRPLAGIHALFEVDEVTVVSVPDLAQRAWSRTEQPAPPAAPPSVEPPASPPAAPTTEFADCAVHVLEPTPQLDLEPPDQGGSFGLVWTTVDEPGAVYELQEGTDPLGWDAATTIVDGAQTSIRLYGRTAGTYFYRVRAHAGRNVSDWSNGVTVVGQPPPGYGVEAEEDYRPNVLIAVQRALLRLCAARADLLAVLSVPEHYRVDAAIAHAGKLRSAIDPDLFDQPLGPGLDAVLPLDASEERALGFGALYHPWLVLSLPERGDDFRRVPPDGSAAGVIAQRAATRGAWVAPANEVLADVIALVHAPPRTGLGALQDAQVNEIRSEPDGFLCLCEDTLLEDDDLRPINVRRLLALVRRIVMREGVRHVFEPNDPVFRRGVERSLGATMQAIYQLGAFAGATAEQAYQVNAGSPPNTPQSIDEGRLIVEIKLAPSRPLAFLLVRLVASGEQGFQVETP